ncbi:MAG TPA: bifunctional hydroxymethylpyrimidine kinase/phosphomethylpyrimidine kinase [Solirubrobacteraceae bacterium]|nr:bifunctional hydroxymethylpyrimidine kinase/phosphomethylpyrimidine kinase [Solirubrobacteraceae bacterium]
MNETAPDAAPHIPKVLSIAGSDSGGGAGIQADLKAFAASGVHGMTAITAITAQNTLGVDAIQQIAPEMIDAQVRVVADDIGVDAVKVGMLGSSETIDAVAAALRRLRARNPKLPIVVDPVMVSETGAALLDRDARDGLTQRILPLATVLTPNLPEARALARHAPESATQGELAQAVQALGPEIVVVTGGHGEQATDVFYDGERLVEIPGERYASDASHGSGCTHSSVLAARLAHGDEPLAAATAAKRAAAFAVRDGLAQVGHGPGPVNILRVHG